MNKKTLWWVWWKVKLEMVVETKREKVTKIVEERWEEKKMDPLEAILLELKARVKEWKAKMKTITDGLAKFKEKLTMMTKLQTKNKLRLTA